MGHGIAAAYPRIMNLLTHWLKRRRFDQELASELEAHLLERTQELVDSGMDRRQAEMIARREFGNLTATLERGRDVWTLPTIESLFKDVRYGARTLARRPGFTAVIVITLALGIGANAAIFGLIDGLWLHPMGVTRPAEIARIFSTTPQDHEGLFSFPEYQAIAGQAGAFSAVVACGNRGVRIKAADGTHELLLVNVVSHNFFDALGVLPAAGRLFNASVPSVEHAVAVLGFTFWQRHFGGRRDIVGQALRVEHGSGDVVLTIIGVLPSTFRSLEAGGDRDLWIPAGSAVQIYGKGNFTSRDFRWFRVVGRLAPNASVERARSQVRILTARLTQEWPASNAGRSANVVSDLEYRVKQAGGNGVALVSVALLVVLLCCLNVANLLLARNLVRRTEFSVRLALGVERLRLARQLIIENALLGIGGLALGLALGSVLIQLLPALFVPPPGMTAFLNFRFDARVVVFSAAVALAALFIFGAVPAWRAASVDPAPALRGSSTGVQFSPAAHRLRRWCVVAQIGISLVLLAGSGALVESLFNSRSSKSGYAARPLLLAWLGGAGKWNAASFAPVLDRVHALPQVKEIGFAIRAPLSLSGNGYAQRVLFPGRADPRYRTPIEIKFNSISSNFLAMLGTPVLRGRGFAELDQTNGPLTALVNEEMARRFWPNEDPVNKTIRLVDRGNAEYRIVGVVRNAPINDVGELPEPYLYLPFWRNPEEELTLVIDAGADPLSLAQPVRRTLAAIDSNLDPFSITTFSDLLRFSTSLYQLAAELVSSLGLLALVITSVGLYGIVSFNISQRVREIGIRTALGAEPRDTMTLVLSEVAVLSGLGMLIGLPCAMIAIRLASGLLFGAGPFDPGVFVSALAILALVLFLAGFGPARRATRIDPVSALRYE